MGLFDEFIDGEKIVQLKNFDPFQNEYHVEADLRDIIMRKLLPMTATYFCEAELYCIKEFDDLLFVHVEKGIFTGIDTQVGFPLFDCQGKYYDETTFKQREKRWKDLRLLKSLFNVFGKEKK